jgi:hypothetical protein
MSSLAKRVVYNKFFLLYKRLLIFILPYCPKLYLLLLDYIFLSLIKYYKIFLFN